MVSIVFRNNKSIRRAVRPCRSPIAASRRQPALCGAELVQQHLVGGHRLVAQRSLGRLVHSAARPSTRILLDSTARIAPVALVSRYSRFVLSFLAYWTSGNALRASLVAPGRTSLSFSSLI